MIPGRRGSLLALAINAAWAVVDPGRYSSSGDGRVTRTVPSSTGGAAIHACGDQARTVCRAAFTREDRIPLPTRTHAPDLHSAALPRVRHRSALRALQRSDGVKDPLVDLRPPLAPMTARPVSQLPDEQHSAQLMFEPKMDGWRCLAFHRLGGRVVLQSRQRKTLTEYFPEITAAIIEQVPAGTVLDGELVVLRGGRCDFAALQRRVSGRPSLAVAASFVAFDVLTLAGRDLRGLPYRERRQRLRRLLGDAGLPLALMPATRELAGAQAWMRDHVDAGVEGVVVKHREHGYRPRRRCWWKVRVRTSADAVVGGVIGPLSAPEALLLGLPDGRGRLRVAGRTGPLTLPARRELGALLVPPRRAHPWPDRIPSSRFGQLPGDLVDYTPTEPLLVVEVDADVCFEQDRWRHPTGFRRVRGDLQPTDLT